MSIALIYSDLDLNQKINFKAFLSTKFEFIDSFLFQCAVEYRRTILVPMVEMYPQASYKMRQHIGIITIMENMCIPGHTIKHVSTSLIHKGGFQL